MVVAGTLIATIGYALAIYGAWLLYQARRTPS
jgi:hypothetical protein